MKKVFLGGIIIVGLSVFLISPLQESKQPVIVKQPVVASEDANMVFVKTDDSPWVKPEAPNILTDEIVLVDSSDMQNIQLEAVPSYFNDIDKKNNTFGQSILGGYCLSSSYNARLAAGNINGVIIQPQAIFSFNGTAGPFNASRGYGVGTVIQNNRYVPGMGGGVCKTSTALYNAAINAGLDIIESHRHSLPVGYAKPGKDAAVSYGVIDLKIRNNRSDPIQIITKTEDGIIYIAFIEHNSSQPQNHEIETHKTIKQEVELNITISDEISLEESI